MKLRLALLLCGLLLAASCTSGTEGIFASIEREQKIISLGGLNANATVSSMTEFGGKYYAAGRRALFSRAVGATAWDKSSVDGNGNVFAVGAVSATGKIYAVTAKDGGTLYSSTDGSGWTAVVGLGTDKAVNLVPIRSSDGVSSEGLVVVTKSADVYFIDASNDPSPAVVLTAQQIGVHSAVHAGTNYYLASATTIWPVAVSGLAVSAPAYTSGEAGFDFAGLIYIDGAAAGATAGQFGFYLSTPSNSTNGGGLYRAGTLPGTITAAAANVKVSDAPVAFGTWLYNPGNSRLMVGTKTSTELTGNGYMEVSMTTGAFSSTPDTDKSNYESSVLPSSSILTLFRSSSGKTFAGTAANGLWVWDLATKTWSQQ